MSQCHKKQSHRTSDFEIAPGTIKIVSLLHLDLVSGALFSGYTVIISVCDILIGVFGVIIENIKKVLVCNCVMLHCHILIKREDRKSRSRCTTRTREHIFLSTPGAICDTRNLLHLDPMHLDPYEIYFSFYQDVTMAQWHKTGGDS